MMQKVVPFVVKEQIQHYSKQSSVRKRSINTRSIGEKQRNTKLNNAQSGEAERNTRTQRRKLRRSSSSQQLLPQPKQVRKDSERLFIVPEELEVVLQ